MTANALGLVEAEKVVELEGSERMTATKGADNRILLVEVGKSWTGFERDGEVDERRCGESAEAEADCVQGTLDVQTT